MLLRLLLLRLSSLRLSQSVLGTGLRVLSYYMHIDLTEDMAESQLSRRS